MAASDNKENIAKNYKTQRKIRFFYFALFWDPFNIWRCPKTKKNIAKHNKKQKNLQKHQEHIVFRVFAWFPEIISGRTGKFRQKNERTGQYLQTNLGLRFPGSGHIFLAVYYSLLANFRAKNQR